MKKYLLLSLLVLGCSAPGKRDASFCLHGFDSDQEVKIGAALDEWNQKLGSTLSVGEGTCDVTVTYMGPQTDSTAGREAKDNTKIILWSNNDPDRMRIYMLHETGHYLANSADHLDNPDAIMYWEYTGQEHLISDDIAYAQ